MAPRIGWVEMNNAGSREVRLGQLFVQLADSLVREFDVVELLDQLAASCMDLLDVTAVGLMLTDQRGQLRVMAASSEEARLLELFELQNQQGPCLDCFRSGRPVAEVEVDEQAARWPIFATELRSRGWGPVYALLNLFRLPGDPMPDAELQIGQALADVATIAVLQHRAIEAGERLAGQLQIALNSRITIEQAKGAIAEHAGVDMGVAFQLLRRYARTSRRRLSDVAGDIASGRTSPQVVAVAPEEGSEPD